MSIRIGSEEIESTLAFLEEEYLKVDPEGRFDYSFYVDEIEGLYLSERRFFRLFVIFALLAILIASLGILGLASFTVEQRTREIGIRKVSGSSISGIILLISREFSILVLIANLFAWPLAWYFMRDWLNDFPERITLGIHLFFLAAVIALVIAFSTIYFQGRKAALLNPSEALRYE
jgi:putative ABC transport system permease protein